MNFNHKTFLLILTGIGVIFTLFSTGCGKKDKHHDTLKIWHWMTDRHEIFQKMAMKYEKETGKKVVFELNAPSDLFTTKVRAAAQTDTLPDIFGSLGGIHDLANFINSGLIHRLNPYLEEKNNTWGSSFFNKAINMTSFEKINQWDAPDGKYGVPIDVTNIQMLYNKEIFKEAGIEKIPETWEEFLVAGEQIIQKTKKSFFVSGFGETWLIQSMLRNFAYNIMGEEEIIRTIKGEKLYSSPEWVEAYSKFKEMADKKLFASGIVTMINKTSERLFATGRAAIMFNGSWCVNVLKGMNPSLNYSTMFFPQISPSHPVVIMGGAGSFFVVSEKSERKEEAVKFLKWMTTKENQIFLAKETNNLPATKEALTEIPAILMEFADDMDSTVHPYLLPVAEDPDLEEAMAKGIQSIIIGEISPEELGKEIEKVKSKIMKSKLS